MSLLTNFFVLLIITLVIVSSTTAQNASSYACSYLYSDCLTCSSDTSCGWCASSSTCLPANTTSYNNCQVGQWILYPDYCPTAMNVTNSTDFCTSTYSSCASCSLDPSCGWCESGDSAQCVSGSAVGPNQAACDIFSYQFCTNVTDPCTLSYSDCLYCAYDSACGWCESSHTCVMISNTTNTMTCALGLTVNTTMCNAPSPTPYSNNTTNNTYSDACTSSYSSCLDCTNTPFCGWCGSSCYLGTYASPSSPGACGSSTWLPTPNLCPLPTAPPESSDPCTQNYHDCSSCASTAQECGWCNGKCRTGHFEGPAAEGACGVDEWSFLPDQCPATTPAPNSSDPCGSLKSCSSCTSSSMSCGWCNGQCRSGADYGPSDAYGGFAACGDSLWADNNLLCVDELKNITYAPQSNNVEFSSSWTTIAGRAISNHNSLRTSQHPSPLSWTCDMTTTYSQLVFDPTNQAIVTNLPNYAINSFNNGNRDSCPNFIPVGVVGSFHAVSNSVIDIRGTGWAFPESVSFSGNAYSPNLPATGSVRLGFDFQLLVLTVTGSAWLEPASMQNTAQANTDPSLLSSVASTFLIPVVPYVHHQTYTGFLFGGDSACSDYSSGINELYGTVGVCEYAGGQPNTDSAAFQTGYVTCNGTTWTVKFFASSDCSASSVSLTISGSEGQCGAGLLDSQYPLSASIYCTTGTASPQPTHLPRTNGPTTLLPSSFHMPSTASVTSSQPSSPSSSSSSVSPTFFPTTSPVMTVLPVSSDPSAVGQVTLLFSVTPTTAQLTALQTTIATTIDVPTYRVQVTLQGQPNGNNGAAWKMQATSAAAVSVQILPGTGPSVATAMAALVSAVSPPPPPPSASSSPAPGASASPSTASAVGSLLSSPLFQQLGYQATTPTPVFKCPDGSTTAPCATTTMGPDPEPTTPLAAIIVVIVVLLLILVVIIVVYCLRKKANARGNLNDHELELAGGDVAGPHQDHEHDHEWRPLSVSEESVNSNSRNHGHVVDHTFPVQYRSEHSVSMSQSRLEGQTAHNTGENATVAITSTEPETI